ncbi:MAG: hypothetical protein A2014_04395 [Spirochaetes bacterium GWF1_49_6]|nr:MAG: hypothetical protein A2014_04395 [Spirochaetes bacterium GWF1_49_6]
MKKFAIIGAALLILSGCVVTSEIYRYKNRFDHFYTLLGDQEKQLFAQDKLTELGASIDKKLASDSEFYKKYREVQIYEAITSFDGAKTSWFFRYIILKELNRENLYTYMNFFTPEEQTAFASNQGINEIVENKIQKDGAFKSFMDSMRTEFRLYGFTNPQINEFFRNVVFPEVSRKQVYQLLLALKSAGLIAEYKSPEKNIADLALKLDAALKGNTLDKNKFEEIKKLSGLSKLDTASFLKIYNDFIMVEMDQDAVKKIWAELL